MNESNFNNRFDGFKEFLHTVETTDYTTNTTSTGLTTLQQSTRNNLRREGLKALKTDLTNWLGNDFDVVETQDGIVIAIENEPLDQTISWEIKCAIKALDYDPFIAANNWDEKQSQDAIKRERRAEEKAQKEANLAARRAKKLAEAEAKAVDSSSSSSNR